MSFQTQAGVRYWIFDSLEEGVAQAIYTRHGGVSPEPWASLNLGGTVGDDLERVGENRRRALEASGRDPATVFDVWQVHGDQVAIAEAPRPLQAPHLQADVILTDRPGVTLMMRFADCVPVFLHDPLRKVAGIAHAGWMGTVKGTVRAAVATMQSRYGSAAANIRAAIGPSIGPDHYEVGADVVAQVRQAFGKAAPDLLQMRDDRTFFDLWGANRWLLEQAGVRQIEVVEICTACHLEDWYSHRAEKGHTGRFGAMIALK
ncbi:MAG: peptidoglycan editing factor PgeF [Anaerolineales bacterium]|jgi:YfiH family protein